jgi:cytosine/adenosine deaminase-related metal-dependent hydrolase
VPRRAPPAARIAIHGDLLDFSAAPAWGDVDSPAVRFRPDHWLLAEDGRIVAVQAEPPGEGWQRHDHRGRLVLPGFIDTHVHSPQIDVIASYGSELLDWLTTHTFGRGAPRRRRACREVAAHFSMPCSRTGRPRRSSSRPSTRRRSTLFGPPGARHAGHRRQGLMDRNAPADLSTTSPLPSARWRR